MVTSPSIPYDSLQDLFGEIMADGLNGNSIDLDLEEEDEDSWACSDCT